MSKTPFVSRYRRAISSADGPKSPTTRLVLHTLAVFMDLDGGNCFPSTATIAESAAISERAVCTHLEIAVESGWLEKSVAGKNGRGWKRHQYHPVIPEALNVVQHLEDEGTEGGSAPSARGTEPGARGTEPDDIKALNVVQSTNTDTNTSTNTTSSSSVCSFLLKNGETYTVPGNAVQILSASYPDIDVERQLQQLVAWCFSNPGKRKQRAGAMRFVNGWMARAAKDQKKGKQQNGNPSRSKYDHLDSVTVDLR